MWLTRFNAVLAGVAVTIGFWIVWGELPATVAALLAFGLAVALAFLGRTIAAVWAWATLALGLESLAWPIMTMWQLRGLGPQPSDEAMSQILTAIVGGLFSSIFWLTFAIGIFRWNRARLAAETATSPTQQARQPQSSQRK